MIPRNLQITVLLLLICVLGAGAYILHLRQTEIRTGQFRPDALPGGAPGVGPQTAVTLAIAYDDDQVIQPREVTIGLPEEPTARARTILRALLSEYLAKPSPHPLGEGSDIRQVYLTSDGLCVVDLNTAFAEGHRSGILVEQMTMASMVETLSRNMPEVRRVKFLVDGRDRETLAGHADLGAVYETSTVHELVAQLK